MTATQTTSTLSIRMQEHLGALRAVALRLTRNAADADDLVQDAIVRALNFAHTFEEGSNLRAWLTRIVRNTFVNRYRRDRLEARTLGGDDTAVGTSVVGDYSLRHQASPEAEAVRGMLRDELSTALDRLASHHRIVVLLADVEGQSYQEIADHVGCPVGTVMSRLHRARKQMQAHLAETGSVVVPLPVRPLRRAS